MGMIIYWNGRYGRRLNQIVWFTQHNILSSAPLRVSRFSSLHLFSILITHFYSHQSRYSLSSFLFSSGGLRAVHTCQWSKWQSSSTINSETLVWMRFSTLLWNQNRSSYWWTNMNLMLCWHSKVSGWSVCQHIETLNLFILCINAHNAPLSVLWEI